MNVTDSSRLEHDVVRKPVPTFRHHALAACLGAAAHAAFLLASAGSLRAEDMTYRLGPEDHIRLKVFEWRASQDAIFEWKAMNDEFVVGAGGQLPIPFVGDVKAEGRTAQEVEHVVSERLTARMNLATPPDVSINVIKYRPFYVAGDVNHPGPYPYQPGLTVLEAVATAGGTLRPGDLGLIRLGREVIEGQGELTGLAHDYKALLVRRSRLQAEFSDADGVPLPAQLAAAKTDPLVARMMNGETQIFAARRKAMLTQTAALNDLKTFLEKEIESLKQQLVTLDTQMALVNKELAGVSTLVQKGMAVAPRELALERTVAQIQGDRLNMQTNTLRVQAEIGRTNIALIELHNNRSTEVSLELRDTQLKLDEIANRSDTRERLLYEAQVAAPKLIAGRLRRALVQPTFTILHKVDGKTTEVPALDTAELGPGDTVKVSLPLPEGTLENGDLTAAGASTEAPSAAD